MSNKSGQLNFHRELTVASSLNILGEDTTEQGSLAGEENKNLFSIGSSTLWYG